MAGVGYFKQELVGVNDMMPIMFWICNFLLDQGGGIVEDLLLDNKIPSLWEQNGSRKGQGMSTSNTSPLRSG